MSATALSGALAMAGVAVLQSTVLRFLEIAGVAPDLTLVVLVFLANRNGVMVGQLTGFAGGVVLDVLGLAPLGFHALTFTILGAAFGVTRGKMFVDPIFIPVILAIVAMLGKALLALLIAGMFGVGGVTAGVFSTAYLIEIGYTGLIAPVVFALLGMLRFLQPDRRKGELF